MADIVLINPRFTNSFWGLEYALPFFGAKAIVPVPSLPVLAALTPSEHTVTVFDENVEEIDFDRCARADIVGVTGMSVQRKRMIEIMTALKERGIFTVVGGPWATVSEQYFADVADVTFVGEAEQTWPQFLTEWAEGRHQQRYEQTTRTDMTTVPAPRFDLLPMDRYGYGSLQISRGCPFTCEFCDIIVTFGRKPRLKTSAQVITELDNMLAYGKTGVFIVDDNLIGNKKAIIPILRDIIAWQQKRGYPLFLMTEASLDLADQPELLELMSDAGILAIFVGIETPNEEALRETKKLQNVRTASGSLIEKVHRIQSNGMEVWSGMIVGFDNDDETIFARQRNFLHEARIVNAMVGMLSAIPKTPLHGRLQTEGRLDLSDDPSYGTNVIPLKMSRESLRDGYLKLIGEIYDPRAYFDRLDSLYLHGSINYTGRPQRYRPSTLRGIAQSARMLVEAAVILWRVFRGVSDEYLKREYARRLRGVLARGFKPNILQLYAYRFATHYHFYRLAKEMMQGGEMRNTI